MIFDTSWKCYVEKTCTHIDKDLQFLVFGKLESPVDVEVYHLKLLLNVLFHKLFAIIKLSGYLIFMET